MSFRLFIVLSIQCQAGSLTFGRAVVSHVCLLNDRPMVDPQRSGKLTRYVNVLIFFSINVIHCSGG